MNGHDAQTRTQNEPGSPAASDSGPSNDPVFEHDTSSASTYQQQQAAYGPRC